ncbi:homogentisate 1,2-dioxygenase [Caldalkalibacillus uzonensis]|uniref:Homogentisate 1,2-dioxygenase n=1 Tax=Caldalkalibacillus uzonensis TaxID=353224 RepID=A0ABU0CR52_9BACI|nr:homogentisate 1,2-dioxygenase [Caldalkalibacillus uzonensis]MDQ0338903.1 homogentisate 1,2-dioxygenase [Caldalkalibacillus uzonensis]
MPFYHRLGHVPHKRHTQFRKADGSLYFEEVMGTKGFSGIQSILYHHYPPTRVQEAVLGEKMEIELEETTALRHRHFKTGAMTTGQDAIRGRRYLLVNEDVQIGICTPTKSMTYFYRNGLKDELIFVHEGEGVLESVFGELPFRAGDYIVIPIGTTYRMHLTGNNHRLLIVEANSRIEVPKRYRNEYGQLLEHSPFCERDIRIPERLNTYVEEGQYDVWVNVDNQLYVYRFNHHPFDVVGWDGYLYPWIFNIGDFEPVTGRIHQPPPVHQTFAGHNFVVCSFVPRLFDYHPEAIPAPYHHSNVNSDEVLYYVDGRFMSRKGIEKGSITLHPSGIPHGPHPGTIEASIGQKETQECAVMIDTFRPLSVTSFALAYEDEQYMQSWSK